MHVFFQSISIRYRSKEHETRQKKQTYYLQLSKTKLPLSTLSKHREVKIVVISV